MATRKCRNIYFPKYFMAFRKVTNIYHIPKYFVLLLLLMVGSRIHYSSFASKRIFMHLFSGPNSISLGIYLPMFVTLSSPPVQHSGLMLVVVC